MLCILSSMKLILNLTLLTISTVYCNIANNEIEQEPTCPISKELRAEIQSYAPIANKIVKSIVDGKFKGTTYDRLATFTDKFGPRFTGTDNLENSIDYMLNESRRHNLENVRFENVTIPHWVRGREAATLLQPRPQNLSMLGLGYSVGTPAEGIIAEAIVVKDFDELKQVGDKVKGKIVVYDEKYISYPETVKYRGSGASAASKYGAVAALIASVTPYSLNTPHTGMQSYTESVKPIPVACITVADSHMLRRMQNRGQKLVIKLYMEAKSLGTKVSRNTIVDIRGSTYPEKKVIIGGHIDSWDVGQGAMDDGGGAIMSWNSLVILKALGLRPRRTLEAILFTGEEMGIIGARSYANRHKQEMNNIIYAMESDMGTFTPQGLAVTGSNETNCIVQEILSLLKSINTTEIQSPQEGPDIAYIVTNGVPGASLLNDNAKYFNYHHSAADTMDVEDPATLDLCTALWATSSYIIADLSVDMPR